MMLPVVLASRVEVRLVFGLVFAVFWALLHEQLHPWRPSTKTITLPRAKRSMRITTDGFAGALVWLVVGIYLLAALIYVLPEKVMSVAIGVFMLLFAIVLPLALFIGLTTENLTEVRGWETQLQEQLESLKKGGTPPAFDVKQFKDHYPDAKPGMRTVMLDLLFEWLRLALKPGRVKERWSEILAVLAVLGEQTHCYDLTSKATFTDTKWGIQFKLDGIDRFADWVKLDDQKGEFRKSLSLHTSEEYTERGNLVSSKAVECALMG